jgi:hypothetical protein
MRKPAHHHGAAYLVTLAALVVCVAAAGTLARVVSSAKLERGQAADLDIARELVWATDAPIVHWLQAQSAAVVLPPDTAEPRVSILDDEIELDGLACRVTITAWDQLGLVPLEQIQTSAHLWTYLNSEMVDALLESHRASPIDGLDCLVGTDHAIAIYPSTDAASMPATAGARIATHNAGAGTINVNTAPIPVLETALRMADRGGIERILAARDAGEPATVGWLKNAADPHRRAPALVDRSDAWAFRIDVQVGSVVESWWAVYRSGSADSPWECVQRLAITE